MKGRLLLSVIDQRRQLHNKALCATQRDATRHNNLQWISGVPLNCHVLTRNILNAPFTRNMLNDSKAETICMSTSKLITISLQEIFY